MTLAVIGKLLQNGNSYSWLGMAIVREALLEIWTQSRMSEIFTQ